MIGMSMSRSPALAQRQVQTQRLAMTQGQRLQLSAYQIGLRIELVGTLRGEQFTPKGQCPRCARKLEPREILAGFNNDVNDFTTECTGCHHRFEPKLIRFDDAGYTEFPFYCGVQAAHKLRAMGHRSPAEIAREEPAPYRSAIVHYGTLAAMFRTFDVEYTYVELESWEAKVQPFLGRMPDTVIGECVGVTARTIARLRRQQSIKSYSKRHGLREAEK